MGIIEAIVKTALGKKMESSEKVRELHALWVQAGKPDLRPPTPPSAFDEGVARTREQARQNELERRERERALVRVGRWLIRNSS